MRLLATAVLTLLCMSDAQAEPATPHGMRELGFSSLSSPDCPPISRFHASRKNGRLAPQKLGELPPADAYRAELRSDGRCQVPVVVKYNVGGR